MRLEKRNSTTFNNLINLNGVPISTEDAALSDKTQSTSNGVNAGITEEISYNKHHIQHSNKGKVKRKGNDNKSDENHNDSNENNSTEKSHRRSRSRAGLAKCFECDHPGCNKRFTRHEHLVRHQLNHSPKEYFYCLWDPSSGTGNAREPSGVNNSGTSSRGCGKRFVREDLRNRHMERHRKGKTLAEDFKPELPQNMERNNTIDYSRKKRLKSDDSLSFNRNTVMPSLPTSTSSVPVSAPATFPLAPSVAMLPLPLSLPINDLGLPSVYQLQFSESSMMNMMPSNTAVSIRPTEIPDIITNSPKVSNASISAINIPATSMPNTSVATVSGYPERQTDLISWLFADDAVFNSETFMNPSFFSTALSPMGLPNLLTPPSAPSEALTLTTLLRHDLMQHMPELENHPDASLDQLNRFLNTYWLSFHVQYAILHKPSFQVSANEPLLIWSMILLGAAFEGASGFARAIAIPLRWIIFGRPEFSPPAQAWVIQSLLLLEVFEKNMTDRSLHERAHLHHGTTIQLIRRGSALIDPAAVVAGGGKRISSQPSSKPISSSNSTSALVLSPSPFNNSAHFPVLPNPWQSWIWTEETKRTAFLAFIVDTSHHVAFGHSTTMSVHEIRLNLPCDDEIWEAFPEKGDTNPGDNAGPEGMPFLTALKFLLRKQPVKASHMGQMILLNGLMSISHEMGQRDLHSSSLDWNNNFREVWRDILIPAFDYWHQQYIVPKQTHSNLGLSVASTPPSISTFPPSRSTTYAENRSSVQFNGCRVPLYHTAYMSSYLSVHEIMIYAGAPCALSVRVRKQDYEQVVAKVNGWIAKTIQPCTSGSNYVGGDSIGIWHAFQLIKEAYFKVNCCSASSESFTVSTPAALALHNEPPLEFAHTNFQYYGTRDPIFHRRQALFLAVMAIWVWSFAFDGPEEILDSYGSIEPVINHSNFCHMALGIPSTPASVSSGPADLRYEDDVQSLRPMEDGRTYLKRMGSYSPVDLAQAPQKGNTVGLLQMVLKSLNPGQFEITKENCKILIHCIRRSKGLKQVICADMYRKTV
ncbi:hypothetical protein NADFUDRAFT_41944 [Nadsonia fulvescens var. elongata DSM 6958]|uniref:C2H2-type domain-containing protein n=1 Tax=Nadsonia fulvescens var. elongata DSM 6958 TaxID=857566 RepID=A0A1E3PKK8_9ASCO|nr:hypothetical protein NADFUDRAFT_41944 [Nadsonia fulvescens var. elongata DSM 6958]